MSISSTERLIELKGFLPYWKNKSQEQAIEEISSYILETKGQTDYYNFILLQGRLWSPVSCDFVYKSVSQETYLDGLEFAGLLSQETWARKSTNSVSVWISPPHPERSPQTKIIFSHKKYMQGQIVISNKAALFDLTEKECLDLAKEITKKPFSAPDLRRQILEIVPNELPRFLQNITGRISLSPEISPTEEKNKIVALEGARTVYNHFFSLTPEKNEANIAQHFGKYRSSCDPRPGAFMAVFNTLPSIENRFFNCPKCDGKIPSGRGITTCPHCGAKKEEYGSRCD